MISLILPYWDRQEAADRAFKTLEKYAHLMLEVIVVDDGNKVPFKCPETALNVRVVRLPEKDKPTPQSRAWNAGVAASRGEVIVLSCIEVLHETPVLRDMLRKLEEMGRDGYVLASAWCPEMREWHCHPDLTYDGLPEGVGPSYLGMMYKDLFYRAGGFDDAYHDGAGYEDKDFIRRLLKAGARFHISATLKVVHPKSGATIRWPAEGFVRNKALYESKWVHKPVTFVCLKAGQAYSADYVNILFDMVRRNLSVGFPGKFVCITDDTIGLDPRIETIPLPGDLETWWGKLYMFSRGLFPDGSRMVFMDLDTLIVGNLDELARYSGKFATLRDFYHPHRVGPAVIAWEAGAVSFIWDEWVEAGKPRHEMGDLWWINSRNMQIDILQDLYPKAFCSYKADCKPYPPRGTAVVCFHGQPKPSNCTEEWVQNVWRIGGGSMAELEAIANTHSETVEHNILTNCDKPLPWLTSVAPKEGHCCIVGGGPSLTYTLDELRMRIAHGQTVYAVNGAAKWLISQGIKPDALVVIDSREENKQFLCDVGTTYIASQCDPVVVDMATNPVLIHMNTPEARVIQKEAQLLSSGSTVGLAAMVIAYMNGYRNIHLYGFDSSYTHDHHAYQQPMNDGDAVIDAIAGERKFKCAPWMVKQVQDFQVLAQQLAEDGCVITVSGDGLLPYVASLMSGD